MVRNSVSVVGIGHGRRWIPSVRRPDEFADLLDRVKADRVNQVKTGKSAIVGRNAILPPDRLVPQDESEALYTKAGEPRKLVVLKNRGHFEVYTGASFRQVMAPTLAW